MVACAQYPVNLCRNHGMIYPVAMGLLPRSSERGIVGNLCERDGRIAEPLPRQRTRTSLADREPSWQQDSREWMQQAPASLRMQSPSE